MKTYSVLTIISFLITILASIDFKTLMSGTAKSVVVMEEIPVFVVLVQYTTSTITASFLVNSANIGIFNKLAKIDAVLEAESISDYYKRSRMETYGFLFFLVLSHLINIIIELVTAEDVTVHALIVLPLYFIQKLEIVAFCKYIAMVKRRLVLINDHLKVFVQEQEKKKNNKTIFSVSKSNPDPKENVEIKFIGRAVDGNTKIRDLASMYDVIGRICSVINEVFNFQIFMTLVSTFTYVVITIWSSLYYYRTPASNSGELINTAIWCFSAIYTVGVMSLACEQLLLVRNETRVLVNKIIMNYDLPNSMRVQAKAFMELVEAWSLRIYIYDLFSVDITLMLKFISVATTYLIVIIQISHFV
ncbi:uncharacterized protein LOC111357805 [Spodoptera litura]|uniref:Gustatory receptor n=1 Tax=Spodoptera litura TaxID=69820 RepID=A0A9J7EHF8_SPOLT|nr:uncharacterized protein LOC111357805 [Spodoptera litura]